ncbi:MAG: esterase-like activity of phytase family protein [Gammaproteobacteria bacterium]|nr:esterase-like activity of phytase family protein [Gammaproteobacteria bacterium]
MKYNAIVAAAVAAALGAPAAHALSSYDLIAIGSLTGSSAGSYADLSGLTGTLENGLPANLLGGIGSAFAYAGGSTYLALPDRGPNATAYDPLLDDTVSYISRFQTVNMTLTAADSGGLPYTLTPVLTRTTLLSSPTPLTYGTGSGLGVVSGAPAQNTAGTYYFTGRSDNFDASLPSTNPANGRLDPEGIRVSNDGKSVFVSDEYGPYVYQFDRATGQRIRTFDLPANLAATNLSPVGNTEIAGNTVGRVANKGMEGLAITPDGTTLVGIMQAPLEQDATNKGKDVRLVTIDIATGTTHEYAYKLTTGSGVSEIVALNDHEFLVDERDGKGLGDSSAAAVKQLFKVDITGATDVTGIASLSAAGATFTRVAKSASPVLDVVAALGAHGIAPTDVPAKIEGLAFGQDITDNGELFHTLWVANDNDFVAAVAGQNNFYVFAIKASDLPTFAAQNISAVPVPGAVWLMGSALAGLVNARRRRA